MTNEIKLGKIAGLSLSALPSAILGSILLWVVLGAAAFLLDASLGGAILGGFIGMSLHWFSELVHHLGHAHAARKAGYPMSGVRLWLVLSTSLYPPDEPELSADVHRQRAWGGPTVSFLLTIVAGVIALALGPLGGLTWWLAVFLFLDNLLVFTLGALMPLGFTDGSTLLEWRSK